MPPLLLRDRDPIPVIARLHHRDYNAPNTYPLFHCSQNHGNPEQSNAEAKPVEQGLGTGVLDGNCTVGEQLHEYDVDLTDYAIGNLIGYMTDHRQFAKWVVRHIKTPRLIEYLRARSDRNVDAPQVRELFSDPEMNEFVSAVEDGPPGGPWDWVPYVELHRRYIQTVVEVRTGLTRQAAEDWSAACAEFARRLEGEGLSLPDGMRLVSEWIRRLRQLQLAVGAVDYVPLADRPVAHPLTTPPADAANVDPRYRELNQEQVRDIERMREVIRNHTDGETTKPDSLVNAASISKQRGRRALRWLEKHGEYKGFMRRPMNNRSKPASD